MSKYESKKGYYKLIFPSKYTAKTNNNGEILYRSSWEQRVFYYMDNNKNVIEWSNEALTIPYLYKLDGKIHRYYPDIVCKVSSNEGVKNFILEIKPYKQTVPPNKPKNRSLSRKAKYDREMAVYIKNTCKWEAATEFCKKNGYEFKIITENEIF